MSEEIETLEIQNYLNLVFTYDKKNKLTIIDMESDPDWGANMELSVDNVKEIHDFTGKILEKETEDNQDVTVLRIPNSVVRGNYIILLIVALVIIWTIIGAL